MYAESFMNVDHKLSICMSNWDVCTSSTLCKMKQFTVIDRFCIKCIPMLYYISASVSMNYQQNLLIPELIIVITDDFDSFSLENMEVNKWLYYTDFSFLTITCPDFRSGTRTTAHLVILKVLPILFNLSCA